MKRTLINLAPAVIALFSSPALAQFEERPESTRIPDGQAEVELDLTRTIPIIRASINGDGPFRFVLDSGASGVVLSDVFAREMDMKVVGTQAVPDMASGVTLDCDVVRIEKVEIGGAVFSGLSAITLDARGILGSSGDAVRGIIGLSTFADCLFTIDYPEGKLRIEGGELPPADGQSILQGKTEADSDRPVFSVDVAGTAYPVHFDSGGMSGITLPYDKIESLPLKGAPTEIGQGRGAGGSFTTYGSTLDGSITMGAYSWESPSVTFMPNVKWVHFGSETLKRFAITWDQRNQRMRFTDPSGVAVDRSKAQRPKRYGIRFNPNEIGSGPLVVEGVIEDGAADRGGLRAGDRIMAIDGKDVAGLSQFDLAPMFRRSPLTMTIERDGKTMDIRMSLD